jgi:Protein of unknown function (DUF3500)
MTTSAPLPGLRYRSGAYTRKPAEITPELEGKIAWRRRAAAEPFRGVATSDGVRHGLFPVRETGVDVTPMRTAARDYLAALPSEQRAEGRLPMDDASWRHWANGARWFLRHGVLLEELSDANRDRAMAVMRSCLSEAGFSQLVTLMRLNRTIGEIRNEEDLLNEWMYWFSVYGEPESDQPWGWQLDGHHVCVNCVFVGDQMVLTPMFLGAEPVCAEAGKFKGTTSFREEESVGRRLLVSLTGRQRTRAVIGEEMPIDLFTGAFRDNYELNYEGLPFGDMTGDQRAVASELLGLYINRANPGHAAARLREIRAFEDETYFSWIGDPDDVFYYRLHSPVLIVEFEHMIGVMFDNDERLRIHIHTVVRTPNGGDYGADLLRQHHERYQH